MWPPVAGRGEESVVPVVAGMNQRKVPMRAAAHDDCTAGCRRTRFAARLHRGGGLTALLLWCAAATYALAQMARGSSIRSRGGGRHGHGERGDVPGWVLITLMTAGIVAALWVVAQEQLLALFSRAINSVSGHP